MIRGIPVRVVDCGCDECRYDFVRDCREAGLGLVDPNLPLRIPPDWLNRQCPHGKNGFKFEVIRESGVGPDGRPNLDATRTFGYAAREEGRYGSHPSHDRFDGDSDP